MSMVEMEIKCPVCDEKALIDHETRTWRVYVFWNNCKCGWVKKYEKYRQEHAYSKMWSKEHGKPKMPG